VPALFVGALSTAIYALANGFWPLLIARMLWGLAWSGIWVGGATMILDVTTDRDRGRWAGLYQTWFFIGGAMGSSAGGLLTDWLGYANAMWIGAGVTALGGIVALVLLPETRDTRRHVEGDPIERAVGALRANRGLRLVASLQGMNRFVLSGLLGATLALLVQDRLAVLALGVATLTGFLSAGRTMLSMLAAPLAGAASDRLGGRWGVASWGVAAAALGMLLASWGVPAAIVVGVAIAAMARGGMQAMVTALIGDLVHHEQRGRAIGIVHTAGDLGSAIGPVIAYAILPWIGLRSIYLLGALLFVLQWGWIARFRSRQRRARKSLPRVA
jgi:MFS family permease